MFLFINTADSDVMVLALLSEQGEVLAKKAIEARYKQSEKLLVGIDELKKEYRQSPSARATETLARRFVNDLKGIIAVKGPGSFTALRIGLTTANTLAWAWNLPIAGVMGGRDFKDIVKEGVEQLWVQSGGLNQRNKINFRPIMPEYGMEPNIGKKKEADV